ncbi:hypothetical protein [Sphingobacterium multivorum]|uniref:hypothetical protein n=1 Tax=Sphingobacterium multivorum TaxID=28454 RepID=UPI0028AB9008|nr:hypothetical protein [Sphingobacterium multivorum]
MNNSVKQDMVQSLSDQKVLIKKVRLKKQYKSWYTKLLSFIFIIPRYYSKKIYVSELYPGTVVRILGIISRLQGAKEISDVEIYKMIENNIPLFIEFLAVGLNNKPVDPPKWLIEALNYHFTPSELHAAVNEVYRRLDVQTFFAISGSLIDLKELEKTILGEEQPTT